MADLLKTASRWLQDQRHQHLTRTVTYRRGSDTVDLAATIGRTKFEVDDSYGAIERYESRDFLVLAEELILGGALRLPERGDRIDEAVGTTTYVYEVCAPGKEPPWRFSDAYRQTLRIHTKLITTTNA